MNTFEFKGRITLAVKVGRSTIIPVSGRCLSNCGVCLVRLKREATQFYFRLVGGMQLLLRFARVRIDHVFRHQLRFQHRQICHFLLPQL